MFDLALHDVATISSRTVLSSRRTGMEPRLSGVTEEDYASGKVRRTTEKERAAIQADVIGTSDADDLRVLRTPGPNSDFAAPDRPQRRFVSNIVKLLNIYDQS